MLAAPEGAIKTDDGQAMHQLLLIRKVQIRLLGPSIEGSSQSSISDSSSAGGGATPPLSA